jgi:hypothetical protein
MRQPSPYQACTSLMWALVSRPPSSNQEPQEPSPNMLDEPFTTAHEAVRK